MKSLAIFAFTLIPSLAFAQTTTESTEPTAPPAETSASTGGGGKILGVDGAFMLPIGDFGDAAGIGIGALLRFEMALDAKLSLTARAGYIHHLEKNSISFSQIPVMAGAKYMLTDTLYGAAELGFVRAAVSAEAFGMTFEDDETNLAMNLGVGMPVGPLDVRAGLNILDLGNAGESMAVAISAGYNFMAL